MKDKSYRWKNQTFLLGISLVCIKINNGERRSERVNIRSIEERRPQQLRFPLKLASSSSSTSSSSSEGKAKHSLNRTTKKELQNTRDVGRKGG